MRVYDVVLRHTYELSGEYAANSAAEAVEQAALDMRSKGTLVDQTVERQMLLEDERGLVAGAEVD